MSDATQLFILAGIWTLVAAFLVYFIRNWSARVVVFALVVGIPFWELPYGYYNFSRLCDDEARFLIVEKFPPQSTVCAAYPFVSLHRELLKAGFPEVETKGINGDVRRYVVQDGKVLETSQSALASTYCMTFVNNIQLPWRVLRHEVRIVRAQDERLVARQSRFGWSGMWWQEAMRPVLGNGGTCSADSQLPILALKHGA